ncbi:MAG: tetratricopeptide repeat protein [Nitrospirae bacterium]|nr:tetratricopeptide repeat protein [Nitrospirota bacterium]
MNFVRAFVSFLLIVFSQTVLLASAQDIGPSQLKIRAGSHDDFFRLVLEGPDGLIASGSVKRDGKDIVVRFSGADFTVEGEKLKIPVRRNSNTLVFTVKAAGELKVFSMDDPSRLVIDVYRAGKGDTGETAPAERAAAAHDTPSKLTAKATPVIREQKPPVRDNAVATAEPAIAKVSRAALPLQNSGRLRKDTQYKVFPAAYKQVADRPSRSSFFVTAAEASTAPEKDVPASAADIKSEAVPASVTGDDSDFLPDKYIKAWDTLKKDNNAFRSITEFSARKPADAASLGAYHFIYGEALAVSKQYLAAIEQFRLAYVHSTNARLKEVALFRRAGIYMNMGFFHEAKLNYSVFIKDFPNSKFITRAHLGLANSLSETGSFDEAVEHYENAGKDPEALFNMANALQKLERVDEARKAYANAMLTGNSYLDKSPETYFLFAENLRTSGKTAEAKKLLIAVESGPFRDSARISLGLIAMDEQGINEAIDYFESVAFSRNMKVKVKALFNLSLAYLKAGKLKESVSTLEQIRKSYPDSSMYDEALLVLAKLYRQEGRIKESVAMLKELVYGYRPPQEAFDELEEILMEASERRETGAEGEVRFTDLWREVGHWMLDESRGEFLIKIAAKLKPEGKPFLQLCAWLADNATGRTKIAAAIELADYYSGLENAATAEKYIGVAREAGRDSKIKETYDVTPRIEARINNINKNNEAALKRLMSARDFDSRDFALLRRIITGLKESGADIRQATAFYEKMINRAGGDADDYIGLADIIYEHNEEKALAYYRDAHEKDPENEWAIYRIGMIVDMPETGEMLEKLQKSDSLVSRLAKTKLQEIRLVSKIEEVYK